MPINRAASPHVNQAYSRLAAAIADLTPPAFTIHPTADQFEDAAAELGKFAASIDEYLHAVLREASANSTIHISHADRISLVSEALENDGVLSDLRDAAARIREDSRPENRSYTKLA